MNANKEDLATIARENSFEIANIGSLAGGDINEVLLVTTTSGDKVVIKLNDAHQFPGMFEAEDLGLTALAKSNIFTIPKVIRTGITRQRAYIMLEFIPQSAPVKHYGESFGRKLATLHRHSSSRFGFEKDNYIGSLPQHNNWCAKAAEFYITQRLEPQLKLAKNRGFDLGNTRALIKTCEQLIPEDPPSLIHGDLWNGNQFPDASGLPCLIDPAVAYAPREMDLAMMKLFGGFDAVVFQTYLEVFPLQEDHAQRTRLWQLYYLLVHLNIFGHGYHHQVVNIIKSYS